MRYKLPFLVISLFSLFSVFTVQAQDVTLEQEASTEHARPKTCSVATLNGTYSYSASGQVFPAFPDTHKPGVPVTSIGIVRLDGAGKLFYRAAPTINDGGSPVGVGQPVHGDYTVRADCTGNVTYPATGEKHFFVITEEGQEVFFIAENLGTLIVGTARKQGAAPPAKEEPRRLSNARTCSVNSIKGTYAVIATENRFFPNFPLLTPEEKALVPPQGLPSGAVGIQYFDGRGNSDGNVETDSIGGLIFSSVGQTLPPASYTVRANCTGTYHTPGGFDANIVITDGGREWRASIRTSGAIGVFTWKRISEKRLTRNSSQH